MPTFLYYNAEDDPTYLITPHGVEWGYSTKIDLAIQWEKMTNGLWRSWDRGAANDVYSCDLRWKGPKETLASFRAAVHDELRGRRLFLMSEYGFYPWGPLIVSEGYDPIRVASMQPITRIGGSSDWAMSMTLVLNPTPTVTLTTRNLADLWNKGRYDPIIGQGWSLTPEINVVDPMITSYESDVSLRTTRDSASKILAGLLYLRGGIASVPNSRDPFGPGVPVSNGGGSNQFVKVRKFGINHDSLDVWSVNASIARIP